MYEAQAVAAGLGGETGRAAMTLMNAARYYGTGDVRFEKVPVPEPVRARSWSGSARWAICGSDSVEYLYGPRMIQTDERGAVVPVTLGHEFAGDIVAVGSGVSKTGSVS